MKSTGTIILCEGYTGNEPLEVPNPECPQAAGHTPCPSGYVALLDWMAYAYSRHCSQSRCPGCGLYVIMRPDPATLPPAQRRVRGTRWDRPKEEQ